MKRTTYWIFADTHFGHDKLIDYQSRPSDFGDRIIHNSTAMVRATDVVVHVGDICIGRDELWNKVFLAACGAASRRYLVRGNHDGKSTSWYLRHGWDFVADSFSLNIYGLDVLFTHEPATEFCNDVNIHGHLHNDDHRGLSPVSDRHVLVAMEHDYCPKKLATLVGK